MKITVVQPPYYAGETPDEYISNFLMEQLDLVEEGGLILLPEYSNAGGLFDPERELAVLPRAAEMKEKAAKVAKAKKAYVAINVLEQRDGNLKNSTYLYKKEGEVAFIYDKIHLPPSEVALKVTYGDGTCVWDVDGLRIACMTCYDVYFNEQIEHIAVQKPDLVLIPSYQRSERTDIICAQAKLTAFRCNAFVVRSSYSMKDEGHGGNSMIVAPNGQILTNLGAGVGAVSVEVDPKEKYMRTAGFGGDTVRNDQFIADGLRPEIFRS